jgi:hypothetical protein
MKLASVRSNLVQADLTDQGWAVARDPGLASSLNMLWPLSRYGPSDGDPVVRAAGDVAEAIGGLVTFTRIAASKPGSVY